MNSITFSVPGLPIAQPRHRVARGRAYVPSGHKVHEYKRNIAHGATKASHLDGIRYMFSCPLKAELVFVFKRPDSHVLKTGKLSATGRKFRNKTSKPDIDNLQKAVFDACSDLYLDDAQICKVEASKRWGLEDLTVIKFTPMLLPDMHEDFNWIGTLD